MVNITRNQHSPVFQKEPYESTIRADIGAGQEVISILATDDDPVVKYIFFIILIDFYLYAFSEIKDDEYQKECCKKLFGVFYIDLFSIFKDQNKHS